MEITHLLAGTMIYLGNKASSIEEGIEKSKSSVEDGSAFRKWVDIVKAHDGDAGVIENPDSYPTANHVESIKSTKSGYISAMDAFAIGMISLELGAGRRAKEDDVDPAAGLVLRKKTGDFIKEGETLAELHTNNEPMITQCKEEFIKAITLTDNKPERQKQITHCVDKNGIHEYTAR